MKKWTLLLMMIIVPLALALTVSGAVVLTRTPQPKQAVTEGQYDRVAIALSAGLAVGLSCFASGMAIASSGVAAISALAEKPDTFFRSFLVVALAEALSIYGLIIGILLWLKL